MDVSHEKLEGMSEAEAMNLSSLSQDLTHSDSPFYMETSNTTSDLPQNEIKNAEREDESKFTLSEEIHGTLDDWLGDVSIGNDSQNLLTQPVDTSISPFRQFEPICKFHLREAFNNKMTFQNLTESLPYMKKPEMQSHVYNCAKDTNMKEDSFKEENPGGTGTSTNEDQLAHKCVTQPSRSPTLVHSGGETLKFKEMSLPKSASVESALKPSQPESFLYKENVHRDVEKPFYKENSFNLFDLRANYTTDENAVSSKGIQSFGDVPEMPVCLHKEVAMGDVDRPGTVSPWSPSWSGGASPEDSKMPDPKQSLESSQPLEEDMDLNEVLQKLQHTNKQQQIRIQDLQSSNKYLEKKIEELQKQTTKQQVFVDIINKLKAKMEELIEDKYRVMLEKSDTDKTLQNLHEVLTHTQKHLQEARNEKETLQLELKKIKGNYVHLQERYMTEMQQKARTVSQCLEMERILSEKEVVEKQQQLKRELEKATTSALDLLKREKKAREQEILSLREEFQKHKKKNLEERQELKSTLKKRIVQVSHLQLISDTEKAENTQLQQQVTEVKQENERLWQQVARSQEQNDAPPQFETPWLTEHSGEAVMADITKDAKTVHSNLLLNCSPGEEESLSPPDVKRTSQLVSRIHSLLALMVGLLTPQLLEHKDRITAFRELIAKEKAFQDQVIEVTSLDSGEAKNIRDVPVLLGVKLNKYHNLNEELDFLIAKLRNLLESEEDHCNRLIEENDKHQRHLGNLINKFRREK
uniref:Cancer-associated gene 1 protein n=1 Tax=Callorhinus ursinus TaxID=34884 RepID=A0A3Q7QMQ6_CALUR|nr:cancer-associated gene 1 protein [Callorhinus ursinus]